MEREDVIHQAKLKLLHIFFLSFAAQKLFPRKEQVFNGNDILKAMSEISSRSSLSFPPRRNLLPVLERVKQSYLIWNTLLSHIPKYSRQTLGAKIDSLFLESLEWTFRAGYLPQIKKLPAVEMAITKLDLVKFFLSVGWESNMLNNKQYAHLSEPLADASKMLVGWKEYLEKKTPPPQGKGERG